jgi:hypothetical protein
MLQHNSPLSKCRKPRKNGRKTRKTGPFDGRCPLALTEGVQNWARRFKPRRGKTSSLRAKFDTLKMTIGARIIAAQLRLRPQSLASCYDANFCAKNFACSEKNSTNTFAARFAILISRSRCGCEPLFNNELQRRTNKARLRLIRVLCFILRGRGRLPTRTWPVVNRICEPCVCVFDPPRYLVARLNLTPPWRRRVSNTIRRERRSLPPLKASRKGSPRSTWNIGRMPRRAYRLTPR